MTPDSTWLATCRFGNPSLWPELVIYQPPGGWVWPEKYMFRPEKGDVLPVESRKNLGPEYGGVWINVWYLQEDILCTASVKESSSCRVTVETANEAVLEAMRSRMEVWLRERNEGAEKYGITSEPSLTGMAADVASWLPLEEALALCRKAAPEHFH